MQENHLNWRCGTAAVKKLILSIKRAALFFVMIVPAFSPTTLNTANETAQ